MLKVAIVGNIASGKTTVEKIIEEKGFKVYDTDKIAHDILAFNEDVLNSFGTNDRKELGKIVFSNPEKLKQLEEIIHPLVKKELLKIFESDLKIVFISVPQLFEAGFDTMFDKIIYITADENIRKERLIKRNSFTPEEALIRIKAQKEADMAKRIKFVKKNNGSIEELEEQTLKILSLISIW